jgi:thioredoxin reductase (NADPH)
MHTDYDVIIIGSGCAGLAAALYTSRAGFRTLVLEREVMGGESMNRQLIENYPGFRAGVQGPDLAENMIEQAMSFGTEIEMGDVTGLEVYAHHFVVHCEGQSRTCRGIIVGSGAVPRKLNVPGEAELTGSGVFYCATCDGPGFAGKPVIVAGGGDSGITESVMLEKLGCKVTVIEFMPQLKAAQVEVERAQASPNIDIRTNTKINRIVGDGQVTAVEIEDRSTGEKDTLEVEGVLVRIGLIPNTAFLKGIVELTPMGQVPVDVHMATSVPGIFAAGDIREHSPMQMATAVGDGVTAAMTLGRYLQMSGEALEPLEAASNVR